MMETELESIVKMLSLDYRFKLGMEKSQTIF